MLASSSHAHRGMGTGSTVRARDGKDLSVVGHAARRPAWHIVAIPWELLAVIAVGVPLLAVLGAGVFTRARVTLVRRAE